MMDEARPSAASKAEGEDRFADLYARFGPRLRAYCARRTDRSRLDDAVSETFLVAWRKLDQVPEGDRALLWLYGVAYRVLQHQWRSASRGRRLVERLGGVAGEVSPGADVLVIRREEHRLVLEAAARLRPVDQEILRLTLWEGLTSAEVGIVLDLRDGAVKQRALRARRNLAREFHKLTKDEELSKPVSRGGNR